MGIRMSMAEVVTAVGSLNELLDMDLPAPAAFRVAGIANALSPHLNAFSATRSKIGEDGDVDALLKEEVVVGAQPLTEDILVGTTIKPYILFGLGKLAVVGGA